MTAKPRFEILGFDDKYIRFRIDGFFYSWRYDHIIEALKEYSDRKCNILVEYEEDNGPLKANLFEQFFDEESVEPKETGEGNPED